MPAGIPSARINFFLAPLGKENEDHKGSGKYCDFIEITTDERESIVNVDTTRVDNFGLKLALRLRTSSNDLQTVGENLNTFNEDREETFKRFHAAVAEPFQHLCSSDLSSINAPKKSPLFQDGGQYASYFSKFINEMWDSNDFNESIVPKPPAGTLVYPAFPEKPQPEELKPPLTAAIHRSVGSEKGSFNPDGSLKNEELFKNPCTFYLEEPIDHYAKFWHDNAIDGRAYAFDYDDSGNQSSFVRNKPGDDPHYVLVAIGW